MKKSIFAIAASTFIACAVLISCSSSAEKVENAETNVVEANKDLDKANEAYITNIENYRKEYNEKFATNEKNIADFNTRIANEKKEAKAEYKEKITKLEQKNTDMKKKMSDYKAEGKENWEKFKSEFSRDMDELGQAFKDLTVNNVK